MSRCHHSFFFLSRPPPIPTLFPYTTLFRSEDAPAFPGGLHYADDKLVAFLQGSTQYDARSEEHTSELQSRGHLVCRLLLEKKKDVKQRLQCISLNEPAVYDVDDADVDAPLD